MPEVYLIMRRADIPDGVLQVVDLWPNTSSKNYIYPPGLGQTGYVHNIPDDAITGGVTGDFANTDLSGLAAYLLGNISDAGAAITDADADAIAGGLVTLAQAGSALDLGTVDGAIAAVVVGASLTGGGSTGSLTDLLAAMAGNVWLIESGTAVSTAGAFIGPVGAFVEGTYKQLYDIGHFLCSNLNGNVSLLKSTSFDYDGTMGAAVTVYDAAGLII